MEAITWREWFQRNAGVLMLFALCIIMLAFTRFAAGADGALLASAKEWTALVLGGFLGLVTGAKSGAAAKNP